MNKITDYLQFKELHAKTKEKLGRLFSNCLLPSKILPDAISTGEVYFLEYPMGFVLLTTEDAPQGFYKLFYFLSDLAEFPDIRSDKPMILEELDSNGKRNNYLQLFVPKLLSAGFSQSSENYLLDCSDITSLFITEYQKYEKRLYSQNLRISSNLNDFCSEAIKDLWNRYLKPTDIPQNHISTLLHDDAHLVCVYDSEDNICGVNWWKCSNMVCEIRHTVTRPDCYRKGIGTCMILAALKYAYDNKCKTAYTFIERDNYKSMKMYQKIGFQKSGKISRQYVKMS